MRELLKEMRNMGKTILISSHILHELAMLCTHIGIIEAGKMIAQGSLDEIYAKLQLMRLVHVQITNVDDDGLLTRVRAIPGVAQVDEQVDRLAIQLDETLLTVEDLLERLHALGARVRMYQPEAMDMETAFMKLTRGKVT